MSRSSLATILASLVLATLFSAGSVSAHSGKQSYLYVSLFDDGVEGRVEIPIADLGPAVGIDYPSSPTALTEAVVASQAAIEEYVARHTALRDDSGEWELVYGDVSVLPTEGGPYATIDFVVDRDFDSAPRSFIAEFDAIIEADPEKDALFHISDDWRSAVFANGEESMLGFSVGRTEQVIELTDTSTLSSMAAIRGLGSDAVRVGVDLLLIAAGVAATMVLVPRRRDETPPVAGVEVARRSLRFAGVFAATATAALVVTGPGPLTLSSRASGLVVASALGAVAIFLVVARFRPAARSFSTGLSVVAGLGFGVGLGAEFVAKGLDRTRPIAGLLAFEVGALIAAVLVALFVAIPLLLLRRTRAAPVLVIVVSVVLLGYAGAWIGELAVNDDWPIEEVANPLRVWPRNFWFVLLAIAAAVAFRSIEQRTERTHTEAIDPAVPDHQPDEEPSRT